ncbi:unnamed protein product [Mucor fragilis]
MYLKPTSTHIIPIYSHNLKGQEPQMIAVDKHVFYGKNSNRSVAFLFSHGTGFHKETLHPIMRRFRDHLRSLREYQQTEITFISWDDRHHGDSARLNERCLTENPNPTDNAMDSKQLVDMFGLNTKYDHLIGVGHSLGACTLLICEHYFPGTFHGLCLIEPVVHATLKDAKSSSILMMRAAEKRKEEWRDMQEFCETTMSKKFFKAFHPEVLELYASYGLYKAGGQMVKLKCSRDSEAAMYRNSIRETHLCSVALQKLSVPTQIVLASKSIFMPCGDKNPFAKLDGNIVVTVVNATHMLPCEEPDTVIPYLMDLTIRVVPNKKQTFDAML